MLETIPYSVVVIAAVALSATCVLAALLHRFGRIVPERGAMPLLVLAVAAVLSSGEIGFDGGYSVSNRIAPFAASLGIVPEANWPLLGGGATNSLFWHAATSDSLTLTWLNALLDRDTNYPVSFQASLHRSGDFNLPL